MKKLTLVVDERELRTIRAALLLLQEQVDALPEDLAEMVAAHGAPMEVPEIARVTFTSEDRVRDVLHNLKPGRVRLPLPALCRWAPTHLHPGAAARGQEVRVVAAGGP